jgi:hypothetical protein
MTTMSLVMMTSPMGASGSRWKKNEKLLVFSSTIFENVPKCCCCAGRNFFTFLKN